MYYKFPIITNINQVYDAIRDRKEFFVARKDDYLVVNYNVKFADTFPTPDTDDDVLNNNYLIRRECRGIIFDTKGNVIRRPYHKFFNWGERKETSNTRVDVSKPHFKLEKMDGSMLVPFFTNGKIRFGTKMGITDIANPVEDWVNSNLQYRTFSKKMIENGFTPIFEWCSRRQRIVIDYPVDRLVLTAIRNMVTGEYTSYENMKEMGNMNNIEVVRSWDNGINDIDSFLEETRNIRNIS